MTIPGNGRDTEAVPKMKREDVTVTKGGEIVWYDGAFVGRVPGIASSSESTGKVALEVMSGSYCFESSGTPA